MLELSFRDNCFMNFQTYACDRFLALPSPLICNIMMTNVHFLKIIMLFFFLLQLDCVHEEGDSSESELLSLMESDTEYKPSQTASSFSNDLKSAVRVLSFGNDLTDPDKSSATDDD